jgi:hypothetical protein
MGAVHVVKDRVWPSVNYEPHRYQQLVHRAKERHRIVPAGRRFGKSHLGGHELTPELLATSMIAQVLKDKGIRREFWIVGPEYSDSEKEFRVFWNDCKRLDIPMDRPGSYNNPEGGPMIVSAWDGAFRVEAKSAKYPSTLVGEGLSGVILSEAAKLKHSVWLKYIRPTLADFLGWSLMTSTPEGKNWFYEMYRRGQDPTDTTVWSKRMPAWYNPIVYPQGKNSDEIIDLRRDMSEEKFNQEIGASFTEFVGRVFKDYDPEIHLRSLRYDPSLPLYLAIDYGWTNPFVCLFIQRNVWDDIFVIAEYRAVQRDINDIAADLLAYRGGLAARAQMMFPDPASPGDSAILEKKLKVKASKDTGGELKYRLEYIRRGLKLYPPHDPNPQPKLMIDHSCANRGPDGACLDSEMQDYKYPENTSEIRGPKEDPLDKDNHAPEALGRFYRGYYGPMEAMNNSRGRANVRQAKAG